MPDNKTHKNKRLEPIRKSFFEMKEKFESILEFFQYFTAAHVNKSTKGSE